MPPGESLPASDAYLSPVGAIFAAKDPARFQPAQLEADAQRLLALAAQWSP